MDISFYLVEFIISKDQVIVPGLGKFFKNRVAGFLDEKTETYYPPHQTLNFTTEYHHDDKFVQFVSESCAISLTSAYAQLDEYVTEIKSGLKTGTFEIPKLGFLSLDLNHITFESQSLIEENDDYFGLPPIEIKPYSAEEVEKDKEVLLSNLDIEDKKEEEEIYSLANQALLAAMTDDEGEKKSKNILQYILIFIILAIISGDAYIYYVQPNTFQNLFALMNKLPEQAATPKVLITKPIPDTNAIQKADSIYNQTDISSDLAARGFDVEKEKVKDSTAISVKKKLIPKKPTIRYEIIIGLYLKKNEAIKRVALLKSNGINAFIVEDSDGPMIKISTATFYDEAAANKELKRIREDINPEAFIKPVKNLY